MSHTERHRFPGARGGWARFDGPAGTLMVDVAIDAIAEFLRSGQMANLGGVFEAGRVTDEVVWDGRVAVSELLGADPAGMVFGANSTSLILSLVRWIEPGLRPGDVVLCTQLDHDANVAPWLHAARRSGAEVRLLPVDTGNGRLRVDLLDEFCDGRARWVAVTGASNVIGTIPDLKTVVSTAHRHGAKVLVDAVHLVPHAPIDIADIGCDALVSSPYKWYGPHCGVLWLAPALRAEIEPVNVRTAPVEPPRCFETGTLSIEAVVGLAAAARYMMETRGVSEPEDDVFPLLLGGLLDMPHVSVIGPVEVADRTPTVAFTVDGHSPQDVALALAAKEIAIWGGHHYALELMKAYGLWERGGVARAGVVRYTTEDDVSRLLDAVRALQA
ncbi:MAG: aminotransferase class V-fold PLP-dependent enzyme [Acidimicrobiales bacterium]